MEAAAAAQNELTDALLRGAADTIEQGERHVQLATDLNFLLINITTSSAATICRQIQLANGFEMYRQLCTRFSIPFGTRSIGYLTKLLKPNFDNDNFEESFAQWEHEVSKFERDNGQARPDTVTIAVLLNKTTGPLQRHLQLLSGKNPTYAVTKATILEYYRSTTAFPKMAPTSSNATHYGGGQAPMDIDAIHKGKGKHEGKHKGKGKDKGKGYGGYSNYGYNSHKGEGEGGKYNPVGQGNPLSGKGQQYLQLKGRRRPQLPRRKRQRKGKRQTSCQHMLPMWTIRSLCQRLQSGSPQHQ